MQIFQGMMHMGMSDSHGDPERPFDSLSMFHPFFDQRLEFIFCRQDYERGIIGHFEKLN